ncbi:uncharacterized protein LOC105691966 [Athalia rosae]|uniref:uncharacterized protein LOC105691966 n=1 Tax=Athalia rosae TaxID=37344 RepID=UPI00203441B6|nr:uncharacterized protein LOC105691966 [Athalia rosae]XP_048508319.1 uncharacterized protein LOC105691966 [Athalia rosae]
MNENFVDEETGERLEPAALRGCKSVLNFTDPENNNLETGEPEEAEENHPSRRRVPFQIPRALQKQHEQDDDLRLSDGGKRHPENAPKSRRFPISVEPFGQTSPIMLLIPIIFYFRWVIVVLMCLECFLHIWAHHKNKYLKDADVYFRSPFHSISSEFCALCQSKTCMDRIGKMQAIRADKFLRQCNYMKRVVT